MRHAVIPDVQAKPGVSLKYLTAIGKYLAEKQPERIICIGDFADMPSLSSYDKGKKSFEGRRYRKDIDAVQRAMEALMTPIAKVGGYIPKFDLTLGNHEHRINRAVDFQPEFDGVISVDDLRYPEWGWNTHAFLEVIQRDGVCYSHYFTTGVMGRPATSAQALLTKKHQSCVAGHQQGLQIATAVRADGKMLTGIISGSCYEHKEDYLGPQGNNHWRGMLMLNDVRAGEFETMPVTLRYLRRRFA
ncbi:MAG: hypothetical protein H0V63_10340 [Burkholderiaceae bacterium]|nr:hypothetical protein [Burkholderiaceae bacterium]